MGVVQISKDPNDIWGAASHLIYDLIIFSINRVGPQDYLVKFRTQFEHRYNAIDLFELNTEELKQFRESVSNYASTRAYEGIGIESDSATKSFNELLKGIDRLLGSRQLN